MKFALIISSLVAAAFAQTINTPESVQSCTNHQVTFVGGTAPYRILVIPGGSTTGSAPIETYTDVPCSPFVWFVSLPPNTPVFLRLQDAAGASVTTAQFTIQGTLQANCTRPNTPPAQCAAASTVSGDAPPATSGGGGNTSGGGGQTSAPTSGGGSNTGSSNSPQPSNTQGQGAGFSNQVGIAGAVVGFVAMGLAALA